MTTAETPAVSLAELTKAPVELAGPDGKKYLLTPVTPAMLGNLERWLTERPFDRLKGRLAKVGEFLSQEKRDNLFDDATAESAKLGKLDSEEAEAELNTLQGLRQILLISLNVAHPELVMSDVERIVTWESMEDIKRLLDKASGLKPGKTAEPPAKTE